MYGLVFDRTTSKAPFPIAVAMSGEPSGFGSSSNPVFETLPLTKPSCPAITNMSPRGPRPLNLICTASPSALNDAKRRAPIRVRPIATVAVIDRLCLVCASCTSSVASATRTDTSALSLITRKTLSPLITEPVSSALSSSARRAHSPRRTPAARRRPADAARLAAPERRREWRRAASLRGKGRVAVRVTGEARRRRKDEGAP
mmetsp:Transcript_11257/g.22641  ORF Transcript_11257/g.22641 Transcript_11257/m.22641 type:complete len:202 (-) Transcript_11257:136-741(-)